MRTLSIIMTAALLVMPNISFAWDEQNISIEDPSGRAIPGNARIEQKAGWFCRLRADAETVLRRFNGEIPAGKAAAAFSRCDPDVRIVMGVFPQEMAVVFVRELPSFRPSHFVPGLLPGQGLREARASPK